MALARTVWEIEHHDVVTGGIFTDVYPNKHLRGWTKPALITLEEAMEVCMVEVTADISLLQAATCYGGIKPRFNKTILIT